MSRTIATISKSFSEIKFVTGFLCFAVTRSQKFSFLLQVANRFSHLNTSRGISGSQKSLPENYSPKIISNSDLRFLERQPW